MKLKLGQIRIDGGTQPRAELLIEVMEDYAEQMKAGVEFPPITVFFDGGDYWLADGFHRVGAHRRAFGDDAPIEAEVIQGTQSDAQWYSFSVNRKHGLRRTNEDKVRAIKAALGHEKSRSLSDAAIADHVGVRRETVLKYRHEMESHLLVTNKSNPVPQSSQEAKADKADDSAQPPHLSRTDKSDAPARTSDSSKTDKSTCRTGRDGRTINTANIGKRAPSAPKPAGGNVLSRKAYKPRLGHSSPCPMIPLTLPLNNPELAAAALWQEFPASFIKSLVELLTQRLQNPEGEKA